MFVAGVAALLLVAQQARADESAYCNKARARAASDAALLYGPTLQVQGVKYPHHGTVDSGVTTGAGYQFRAIASLSPLDMYKGVRTESVGDADCAAHEATLAVQEVLAQGSDVGRLAALMQEAAYFEAHRAELARVARENEERFTAQVTTLAETNEIRGRVAETERAEKIVLGELHRLEARGPVPTALALDAKVAAATARTMGYERELSSLRNLDAWDFRLSGGLIPQDKPVDYFALVQVGFNFGAFSRNKQEARYLAAREEELHRAKYEATAQTRVLRDQWAATLVQARAESALIRRDVTLLDATSAALAKASATNAPHALAMVTLQRIGAEAQLTYVDTLAAELARATETSSPTVGSTTQEKRP